MLSRIEESASTNRAAMALNNQGVAMMVQGQFYNAIEIFKETFSVINSNQPVVPIPSGGVFENVFLPSTTRFQVAQTKQVSLRPLQICPCDNDDMSAMMNALPSVSVFALISLRSRDFYDPHDFQKNVNFSLAIMMYHNGLAYLLAHIQDKRYHMNVHTTSSWPRTEEHDGQKQLFRGAEVSLNSAQVMIDRHLMATGNAQVFEKLETLLVLAMILKSVMFMYRLENQSDQAKQTRAMLAKVLTDIQRHQDHLHMLNIETSKHPTSSAA